MRAAIEMGTGRAKLKALLEKFPSTHTRWSEAENRFQFIDELLKECLGWQKPDMHVEVTDEDGGRADYILGATAKGVLEAKRLGEMARNGFAEHQTSGALRHLAQKKLVETPYSHFREVDTDEDPTAFMYRATSVGIYHARHWAYGFSFLDAVSTDTPIFSEETRVNVTDLAASLDIRRRLVKAGAFKEYLLESWHAANFEARYFDFPSLLESQKRQFDEVGNVVGRMTGFAQARAKMVIAARGQKPK